MLLAIFYARFHPGRGPSIIHEYPKGSIKLPNTPQPSQQAALLTWTDISAYIVPPYELCNQPLFITDGHRILGFPVSLEDAKYERNRFTFNVCFVLPEDVDHRVWDPVVRKTALFFQALEQEDGLLTTEEHLPGLKWAGEEGYPTPSSAVYPLLRDIMTEINMYGETCLRVNDFHTLNLRLDVPRVLPRPPKVDAWQVPLLIRPLPDPAEWTWDLTLKRIHAHIDGVHHVQRIAELADVEVKLVKRAVGELILHGRAMLLDIFHFQAIYTATEAVSLFVIDLDLQDECANYVAKQNNNIPSSQPSSDESDESSASGTNSISAASPRSSLPKPPTSLQLVQRPSRDQLITLYTSFHQGQTLQDFCLEHSSALLAIDIRRLVTFGTIKGLLRRIHKYALATHPPTGGPTSPILRARRAPHLSNSPLSRPSPSPSTLDHFPRRDSTATATSKVLRFSNEDAVREFDRAWKKAALSSGWATPPSDPPPKSLGRGSQRSAEQVRSAEDERLRAFLDGQHCLDEVCVAMHTGERKVLERLRDARTFGEVLIFHR